MTTQSIDEIRKELRITLDCIHHVEEFSDYIHRNLTQAILLMDNESKNYWIGEHAEVLMELEEQYKKQADILARIKKWRYDHVVEFMLWRDETEHSSVPVTSSTFKERKEPVLPPSLLMYREEASGKLIFMRDEQGKYSSAGFWDEALGDLLEGREPVLRMTKRGSWLSSKQLGVPPERLSRLFELETAYAAEGSESLEKEILEIRSTFQDKI